MSRKYVEMRCSQSDLVRYETLEGRKHLVVPVVMLIGDTVVQGANAKAPEFIPLSTIESHFVAGWNSKPVVPYHPRKNGKYVSANDPVICDSARLGPMFNTHIEDGKLKTEAWIDIDRCHSLGGDAEDALTKLENGESIDVSGGFIVDTIKQSGIAPNGAKYSSIWTDIDADHLALLPNSEGACNQEMGCGAPRIHSSSNEYEYKPLNGEEEMPDNKPEPKTDGGFLSRLFAKLRPSLVFDDGQSDNDLREMLGREIKKLDPTFDWVCRVFPESNAVIYSTYTMTMNWDSLMKWWRRTYTLSADGKSVTVNNDAVEVRPKEVWETVDTGVVVEQEVIAAQEIRPNAPCSCQNANKEEPIAPVLEGGIQVNEERKTKVNELITAEKYTEEDRACLEGMTEKVFQSIIAPAPEVKVEVKTEALPVITEEQALAALPGLRDMVGKYRAQEEARKTDLVSRLVNAQKVHDETALKAMELSRLEEIAQLINLDAPKVDFSLHGAPKSASASPVVARKLPDPWGLEKKQAAN